MSQFFTHLECGHCGERHDATLLHQVCAVCGGPLLARYDLGDPSLASLEEILSRPRGQLRFHEVLPTDAGPKTPTLGEGGTPMFPAPSLGSAGALIKDEAQNPTGSFKARGMAIAVARNAELGATRFGLPSNGNAGGAAAAYGALHGVDVSVSIPSNTPKALIAEAEAHGAAVTLVDGTISEAAAVQRAMNQAEGRFSLATLYEPYRIEGKKMMAYEIFWDLGRLPNAILYPTGGGTGLVAMVKAFDEMEQLGWIGPERPRMVAVQVEGCAPIVRAFQRGDTEAGVWVDPAETAAFGLRVPSAIGDRLMLEGLRATGGTAVAVSEDELMIGTARLAAAGVWGSPEGGAVVAGYQRLLADGWVAPDQEVVLFNTGSALKYL